MVSTDLIVIVLLVLIVILLVINFFRTNTGNNSELKNELQNNFKDINTLLIENSERLHHDLTSHKIEILKSALETSNKQNNLLQDFKSSLTLELNNNFYNVNTILEAKLLEINKDMHSQITNSFAKTNEAFVKMIERLAQIDEAQKKIEKLSTNIVSLQDILNDKKARGAFGEVQLNNILKSIFGEKDDYYKTQYKLSNGMIVDALLKVPDPVGNIAIDSKFPLESYRKMIDTNHESTLENIIIKQFNNDLKKHIDDISVKYILEPETTNSAIMFIPAEAVFAQINAYHQDVIEYASKKKVWLTSPTTLMATLTSIQVIVQNIEQSKYAKVIHEHLQKLNLEFKRYNLRWESLVKKIESVNKETNEISTTTRKISNEFEKISSVQFDEKEVDLIDK